MILVPGCGPIPADLMAIAEAPGSVEARLGRPLCGPSGQLLNWFLGRHDLSSAQFYLDNVFPLYYPGNPDPTPAQIEEWTPRLLATIAQVRPKVILALGRFAARWFLGDDADMDAVRGIPHQGGEFDPSRRERAHGAVIVPSYHTAFALHAEGGKGGAAGDKNKRAQEAKAIINRDIECLAEVARLVRGGRRDLVRFRHDPYAGRERYSDLTGAELERELRRARPERLALDTEGDPDEDPRDLWIQVSWEPGTGYALRARQDDFARGIAALQETADRGCVIVTHDAGTPQGTGYDTYVARVCGLELRDAEHAHTMYDAFLLRLEPKGLKPLLWRWCGMRQDDYLGLIGDIGRGKQIRYLEEVAARKDWPRVPARVERENNGVLKLKKFGKLESRAKKILGDIAKGKRNKKGEPTDPKKRWEQLEPELRRLAQDELGRLPTGNLYDIEFDKALFYACLSGSSIVETEHGPRQIGELVKARYSGRVWSVDYEGRRVLATVNGWHRNTKTDPGHIRWYSVETDSSRRGRWGQLATRYTDNHKLLTSRGWRSISEITPGDLIATGVDRLTNTQYQLVLGSVLGDGTLARRNEDGWVQFCVSHNERQLEYLKWKAGLAWGSPAVKLIRPAAPGILGGRVVNRKSHYGFACQSHPQLIGLRRSAYSGDRNEIVVGTWAEDLRELGLAIWYQDDGTLVSGRYARIYTLAMKEESIEYLKRVLWIRFGIRADSYVDRSRDYSFGGHILTVGGAFCDDFFGLIAPFVHPSMRYKLPEKFRNAGFPERLLQVHRGQFYSRVTRVYENPIPGTKRGGRRTSYCIDVQDTHNFITSSGEVAHNCRDADGTGRLDAALAQERHRMGVAGVYETGCQVLPIFEEMQHEGMPASRRAFVDLAAQVDREMQEIQAGLSAGYFDGRPFNPAPNTKDVETLVRRLGITGLKVTKKSRRPSTSMKSLEYLAPRYPAIREVGEWRRRQKVLHTYCLPLIEIADRQIQITRREVEAAPDLFLVRCKLKPVSVETRRLAAEDPSLLNQPSRTALGRKVRGCYMTVLPEHDDPEDPHVEVFGAWDFAGQEVRVAAHVSGDRRLCAIMRDASRDIHYETASAVFGKPIAEIKKNEERTPAKTAFFGMLYGLSGLGLLDLFRSFGLETWALADCERLIAGIFRIYPGLREAIRRAEDEARRTGMIRDLYGHIRYLPGIWSGSRGEQAEAGRQAFSHVVQGSAQGMMQCAMASLRRPIRELRPLGVKWALQIHDEAILRFPRWLYPVMDRLMIEHMTKRHGGPTGVRFNVPILADGHMSTRWDSLKG